MFKMKLDKSLAFQVVNTIKDTCGQDINFIDKQGMIFASTNADRIGTFPEHKKGSICHSIITAVFLQ